MEEHGDGQAFLSEQFAKEPAPKYARFRSDVNQICDGFGANSLLEFDGKYLPVDPKTLEPPEYGKASSLVVGHGMRHSTTKATGLYPGSTATPLSDCGAIASQQRTPPDAVSASMSSKHCYLLKLGAKISPAPMDMARSRGSDPKCTSPVHKKIDFASDADGNVVQNQLHDAFPSLLKYGIAKRDQSGKLYFMPKDEPSFKEIKSFVGQNGAVFIVPKVQNHPVNEHMVDSGVFLDSMQDVDNSLPLSGLNVIKKMCPSESPLQGRPDGGIFVLYHSLSERVASDKDLKLEFVGRGTVQCHQEDKCSFTFDRIPESQEDGLCSVVLKSTKYNLILAQGEFMYYDDEERTSSKVLASGPSNALSAPCDCDLDDCDSTGGDSTDVDSPAPQTDSTGECTYSSDSDSSEDRGSCCVDSLIKELGEVSLRCANQDDQDPALKTAETTNQEQDSGIGSDLPSDNDQASTVDTSECRHVCEGKPWNHENVVQSKVGICHHTTEVSSPADAALTVMTTSLSKCDQESGYSKMTFQAAVLNAETMEILCCCMAVKEGHTLNVDGGCYKIVANVKALQDTQIRTGWKLVDSIFPGASALGEFSIVSPGPTASVSSVEFVLYEKITSMGSYTKSDSAFVFVEHSSSEHVHCQARRFLNHIERPLPKIKVTGVLQSSFSRSILGYSEHLVDHGLIEELRDFRERLAVWIHKNTDYEELLAMVLLNECDALLVRGDIKKAEDLAKDACQLCSRHNFVNDRLITGYANIIFGGAYMRKGSFDLANECFLSARQMLEPFEPSKYSALLHYNIGTCASARLTSDSITSDAAVFADMEFDLALAHWDYQAGHLVPRLPLRVHSRRVGLYLKSSPFRSPEMHEPVSGGNLEKAWSIMVMFEQQYLHRCPPWPLPLFFLGKADYFIRMGITDEGIEALERAEKVARKHGFAGALQGALKRLWYLQQMDNEGRLGSDTGSRYPLE